MSNTIAAQWLKQEINDTGNEILGVLAKRIAKHSVLRREIITGIQGAALNNVLLVVNITGMIPVENDDLDLDTTPYENSLKNRLNGVNDATSLPKIKHDATRQT